MVNILPRKLANDPEGGSRSFSKLPAKQGLRHKCSHEHDGRMPMSPLVPAECSLLAVLDFQD